jgi:hypothetical protein
MRFASQKLGRAVDNRLLAVVSVAYSADVWDDD